MLNEIRDAAGEIVHFIDELHTIVGAGAAEGAVDAANLLKPMLARGELRAVGATTLDEYRKHVEKDAALERRFQPIFVGEPSVEDTLAILRGLKERYEAHHGLTIRDSALIAAAVLSDRYISDRQLPDKAIDLVDEAASRVRMEIDSSPLELDEATRRVRQLEIELAAMANESAEVRAPVERELAEVKRGAFEQTVSDDGRIAYTEARFSETIEDDPEFDTKRAKKKLRRYVESHDHAIRLKAEIMVDHFHEQVLAAGKIGGQARAMVVTSSIDRAIQYFYAFKTYLPERKSPYQAIVAFSGEHEYDGIKVSESSLNGFPSGDIAEQMHGAERRDDAGAVLMIVAVTLFVLVGMLVLTVDLGRAVAVKREMVTGTDAAALAAAQQCALGNSTGDAQAAAEAVLAENKAGATVTAFDAPGCGSPPEQAHIVTVESTVDVTYFFAGIFGFDSGDVVARAVAQWGVVEQALAVPITVDYDQLSACGIVPDDPPDEVFDCNLEYPKERLQEPRWGVLDIDQWGDAEADSCSVPASELSGMISNGGSFEPLPAPALTVSSPRRRG